MAGDWMKFELSTPDKPEVHRIAADLKIRRAEVLGCLIMVWRWFDQQSENGNAPVTLEALDEYAGCTGFASAMAKAGWLNTGENGISLPNFDRHNGQTAKKRALTAKRASRLRNAAVTLASRKTRYQEREKNIKKGSSKSTSKTPPESGIPPGSIICKKCNTLWSGAHANGLCNPCWREDQGLTSKPATSPAPF